MSIPDARGALIQLTVALMGTPDADVDVRPIDGTDLLEGSLRMYLTG